MTRSSYTTVNVLPNDEGISQLLKDGCILMPTYLMNLSVVECLWIRDTLQQLWTVIDTLDDNKTSKSLTKSFPYLYVCFLTLSLRKLQQKKSTSSFKRVQQKSSDCTSADIWHWFDNLDGGKKRASNAHLFFFFNLTSFCTLVVSSAPPSPLLPTASRLLRFASASAAASAWLGTPFVRPKRGR